jgi:hypothetical protein
VISRSALGVLVAMGCAAWAAPQPAAERGGDEVIEAAFRQQASYWLNEDARKQRTVVCLAIEREGVAESVEADYLQRFRALPELRRAAQCEARPRGAVERETGRPAVLLVAGELRWIAPDEAWVSVRHFRSQLSSGVRTYRVVRESSRWICLGPILKLSPA